MSSAVPSVCELINIIYYISEASEVVMKIDFGFVQSKTSQIVVSIACVEPKIVSSSIFV
ncbi:hypothetical protein [Methanolobus chelungpuianus]|uniref:hypothetical protein n=1 Tax=Methanolobus chelungpuianus TaxID=502115 RepID=UPI002113A6D6|nr:hypothetical protein [Methanolobus chelungpuianus]